MSPRWTYEEEPSRSSLIEVTFIPEGLEVARVDLAHRHLERDGPETERMRRILDGKGAEPLNAFARHIAVPGTAARTSNDPDGNWIALVSKDTGV